MLKHPAQRQANLFYYQNAFRMFVFLSVSTLIDILIVSHHLINQNMIMMSFEYLKSSVSVKMQIREHIKPDVQK